MGLKLICVVYVLFITNVHTWEYNNIKPRTSLSQFRRYNLNNPIHKDHSKNEEFEEIARAIGKPVRGLKEGLDDMFKRAKNKSFEESIIAFTSDYPMPPEILKRLIELKTGKTYEDVSTRWRNMKIFRTEDGFAKTPNTDATSTISTTAASSTSSDTTTATAATSTNESSHAFTETADLVFENRDKNNPDGTTNSTSRITRFSTAIIYGLIWCFFGFLLTRM
ncbi:uncharacterized protein LOC123292726 [Chrysoperla carnea]|uniref:uncharacterized protein LOC123292726 n=1 Tax=Chrysoperla carnea TaxID=189513 RepID=UPI001D096CF9|nr:uncharacterized protein LOC123292726 [Chrysoperla carnea]